MQYYAIDNIGGVANGRRYDATSAKTGKLAAFFEGFVKSGQFGSTEELVDLVV